MYAENAVIKDLRVLTEQFIPRRIIHRTGQMEVLRDNLKPIIEEEIPRNSFVYGQPGTGKTCISQFVVDELKAYAAVSSAYVNCWMYPSRFKVLYNILSSFGHSFMHRKGTPTDELLDILKGKLKNRKCVVVLDEADQLEDDKVLYDLLEIEGVCLVLISNSETIFYNSDPRVRSRMQSLDRIEFRPYSNSEIADILKDRVEFGLVPDVIDSLQIQKISGLSEGDCRKAINMLRMAAELAEKTNSPKILDGHIEKIIPRTVSFEKNKMVESLNTHQKILYGIIKASKEIPASELYEKFKKTCAEKASEEIVDRTVRKYLEKIENLNLISSSGNGRWTVYKAV